MPQTSHKEQFDEDTKVAELYEKEVREMEERQNLSRVKGRDPELLITQYGDGLPYDRVRIMDEIRFYMNQTVEGIIETGKRFIVLKENEKGNFYNIINELKISAPTAWRFMAIAKKIANVSRVKHLVIHDLKKGIGKLYAFLDIPDDELKEFEETGELRGLTISEIDALPVKELKDRLKKRDRQVEQGLFQLHGANDEIKNLKQQIYDLQNPKLFDSKEDEFHAFIAGLGMKFEQIRVEMRSKIQYQRGAKCDAPPSALRKLYYLLLYIQRETREERLLLAEAYDPASEEIPWEPVEFEYGNDDELRANTPHLADTDRKIKEYQDKKAQAKK